LLDSEFVEKEWNVEYDAFFYHELEAVGQFWLWLWQIVLELVEDYSNEIQVVSILLDYDVQLIQNNLLKSQFILESFNTKFESPELLLIPNLLFGCMFS
jgi:hypothetical protein